MAVPISYNRDAAYGFPLLGAKIEYEASTNCKFIDITQYERSSGLDTICREGSLDDENFDIWLNKGLQSHQKSDVRSTFAGGLRLIYGACGFHSSERRTIPFRDTSYKMLERCMGLTAEFKDVLIGTTGRAYKYTCPESSGSDVFKPSTCFVFRFGVFRPSFYQFALSYDPTKRLTYALLLSKTHDHEYPLLIQHLKEHKNYCRHPLLSAALMVPICNTSTARRIQTVDTNLNELEESAGQHEYANIAQRSPLKLDFVTATRKLNFAARNLGVESMRSSIAKLTLEFMLREVHALEHDLTRIALSDLLQASDRMSSAHVKELIEASINMSQNLNIRATYQEKRVQALLAVVYQFMAHKEAVTNGRVARNSAIIALESKKDSSAMKAIAVLTMCFLPGTFLAAIFAMPVIDWSQGPHPTVKLGFKYYWAIAIPVTLLVLVLWGLAVWLPWNLWLSHWFPRRGNESEILYEDKDY
ncbi:hypothetical protein BJ875DRAFT_529145 [Amylocarpus encephaloides]|uniref:Uncharacterized protein n=1 Tax=Amylocarpus encephaloides TaxID=45428 RepID=A0A9P7Y7V0_9HELO|nr:hypothetical protein BJ875DRAFT_529145 [Amylocarpus encephaloides]